MYEIYEGNRRLFSPGERDPLNIIKVSLKLEGSERARAFRPRVSPRLPGECCFLSLDPLNQL